MLAKWMGINGVEALRATPEIFVEAAAELIREQAEDEDDEDE